MVMEKRLILASGSPRRRALLEGLGLPFEVRVLPGLDEHWPAELPAAEVALYVATKKASAYAVAPDELLIAADTVVVLGDTVLGKPADEASACRMLHALSGRTHRVITGVCMKTDTEVRRFSVTTEVDFRPLTDAEIAHYVSHYHPLDKAGAYGIQEWIGYVGVTALRGSYYNVMGLPVQRVYRELVDMVGRVV